MHTPDSTVVLSPDKQKRAFFNLFLAVGAVGFAMALQMGLNANFVTEDLNLSAFQLGLVESSRETCGIFALFILALLAGFAEPLIGAVMLGIFAIGLSCYAFVPNLAWVLIVSFIWSQGLHVWMPLPNSLAMSLAEEGKTGFRLGQVGAAGSAGFGIGLAAAWILNRIGVPMRPMYLMAGAIAIGGAIIIAKVPNVVNVERPRLVFRKNYWRYYLLCFLEGWRKQIFVCFAGYLLVKGHHTTLGTMLLLRGLVRLISWLSAPRVGHLVDRIGERHVLVFYFSCLTLFFTGYALIDNAPFLRLLFVVDNAFFVFVLAQNTYVNKLVPPQERTPTLSMGVAMNHVAAVLMPLVGGIIWLNFGHRWTFATGALAALLSLPVALSLPATGAKNATTTTGS